MNVFSMLIPRLPKAMIAIVDLWRTAERIGDVGVAVVGRSESQVSMLRSVLSESEREL